MDKPASAQLYAYHRLNDAQSAQWVCQDGFTKSFLIPNWPLLVQKSVPSVIH